jgi:hypothetical protein
MKKKTKCLKLQLFRAQQKKRKRSETTTHPNKRSKRTYAEIRRIEASKVAPLLDMEGITFKGMNAVRNVVHDHILLKDQELKKGEKNTQYLALQH